GGQRRILRNNEKIRAELHPLFATREHIELYNQYHRFMREHRGWPCQRARLASYSDSFLSGPTHLGRQCSISKRTRLVGVSLMDDTSGAISLVYFFHHPDWRARSPGTFSILNQILYARSRSSSVRRGNWLQGLPPPLSSWELCY